MGPLTGINVVEIAGIGPGPVAGMIQARENFLNEDGMLQPAPAPKFSATPQRVGVPPSLGQHTEGILQAINMSPGELWALKDEGVI